MFMMYYWEKYAFHRVTKGVFSNRIIFEGELRAIKVMGLIVSPDRLK